MTRESMEFDVVIVGAGPAGLAAAIRLKQLNSDLNIVVLEKGSEVGAHILSGAVIDPIGLDRLLPDWRDDPSHPLQTPVKVDKFSWLGKTWSMPIPNFIMPPLMNNHGNFIVSLGLVCRWLGSIAENLGVEIYPGFAAKELVFSDDGSVIGVATGDMGIQRDGSQGPAYMPGMELHGKYVLFAEGVRGSLSKQLIKKYKLGENCEPAKFGLGIKELWEIPPEQHQPGLVQHTLGWPLKNHTGGGSFLYHLNENQVALGFIVHLNYKNPFLSPFDELQRFKTHPAIRPTLEGGTRLSYGARAISEGGLQSIPKTVFPGGALLGCSAGMLNVPRIKGSHNAMLSGIVAAEAVDKAIAAERSHDELSEYEARWRNGEIGQDLRLVRNVKPLLSKLGTLFGTVVGGFDMWVNQLTKGWSLLGTLKHGMADHQTLDEASKHQPIDYPKPDGKLSFDKTSSVFLSNTNHEEDQPVHLRVENMQEQIASEFGEFAGPSARYCPAGVYEWIDAEGNAIPTNIAHQPQDGVRFQINAQNCVHCKTCDIKDPNQNIEWTTPQGGEGPLYQTM
ncbi:MAG: electron transfer flavoprotein-ubiquinone oxidoreductase [Pseudomonadales bacterium]